MVIKREPLPNVFALTTLRRRSSCRDIGSPLEAQQTEPICKEAEDSERSSPTSSGLGSQLDLAVEPRRGKWASKADFIFSCISYAVGLGNVWRFPYLCYENGGGAFLVPYFICLLTTAVPMFYLEVAVGQYLSKGGIGVWALAPMFKGIGIASFVVLTLSNVYYMVIVAWILFYLISSFATVLPWKHCGNHWNTDKCWEHNDTYPTPPHNGSVTPIVEFWENHVLGITSGLHEIGNMRLEIALYLLLAWATVYLVIWRGLHQSGKIVWVVALFPYVCLFILLVRGVTLSGATDGLLFYIKPDWSQLLKPKVWIAAGTQVFYSYGVGFGSLMTLGSYNEFHQNFFRDSAVVCVVNPMTSILSGTVIFSVLGHMAFLAGKTVGDVVKSGPGLAFLVYPEVVTRMPASTIWSILFFVMLLFLGINSQFCPSEAIVAGLIDQWPRLVTRRRLITFCLVVLQFLLGLPMTTQASGGMYIFQLMDNYAVSGITLLFIVFFQAVALAWVYGTSNLSDNIKEMIGRRPILLLRLGWTLFIPAMCVAIFLFSVIKYQPLVYAKTYAYPWWAEMLGWFMSLASIIMIPTYMVYFLVTTPGSLRQSTRLGIQTISAICSVATGFTFTFRCTFIGDSRDSAKAATGAFLVPYFICLVTTAVPMFYLEVAMGQYLSKGGIGIWSVAPMFKGIGIASFVILALSNIYYMVIVAWILFYLLSSFAAVLPWKHCGNHWNTDKCWEHNETHPTPPHNRSVTPIMEFWENRVLGITSGLHDIGTMRLELALYLLIAWVAVYFVIWKGLHKSGKIVWVLAVFPYVCLFILLVRGVTLNGSSDGLLYYITPDWSQLLKPKVWIAAGTQVFYSYGVGFGSLVTLGSYNKFHQNFIRDSAIVCIINPMTSLLSGTVIFSVLGHMASVAGKSVGDVVKSGPGLAFLVYPEVVTRMPASMFWSMLFFVMLLFLGINSQFCTSEAVVAGVIDKWPSLITRRKLVTFCLVVTQFLLGLPMATQGGMYLFQLMDNYAISGITLLFIVFAQATALSWVYGTTNISDNIKEMIGRRPSLLLRLGWTVFAPVMCVAIFLFSVIKYQPLVYAKTYTYPWWGEMLGWFMALSSMVMIPAYVIYFLLTTPGSLRQRIRAGMSPQLVECDQKEEEEYPLRST
ncbi:hypothetical protein HPB49_023169 [Dermacentor silvarum]|uniref:Uncharacterized protein n=1 Tax=Dermacentor silvarum TaxID=543639 RepID=A0ACB8CC07_DERSI|nr:hypothetical protein HPB49_023169 [Dermacentor silvarum]